MGQKENQKIDQALKEWKEKIKKSTLIEKEKGKGMKNREIYTDQDYQHLRKDLSEGASGETDSLNDAFPGDDY